MTGSRPIPVNRAAMDELEDLDLVTQDMLIGHTAELEKFQWFVRAHLENASGSIPADSPGGDAGSE